MTGRWPLHPPPSEGEALTSWLSRLAEVYGMSVEDLLRHSLAAPGVDLPTTHQRPRSGPATVAASALAERTGEPLGRCAS